MIIGISGYSQSGKDTLGMAIQTISPQWQIKKFAGKLKTIASLLTGVSPELFESQEFKNWKMGEEWNDNGYTMTYREFLQTLGTEAIRDSIHPNAWVNALMADYTPDDHWVVTDVRFPNEANAIKEVGGVIVRINRPSKPPVNKHLSEIALDQWEFDYHVENDKDIVDLLMPAKKILHDRIANIFS